VLWNLKQGEVFQEIPEPQNYKVDVVASLIFTLKLRREIFVLGMTDRRLT